MANPVDLLLAIADTWPAQQETHVSREVARADPSRAWKLHRIAVGHLLAIEQLVDALEASGEFVSHYRSGLTRWTQFVFAEPSAWGLRTNQQYERLHIADRDLLTALSQQINQAGLVNQLNDDQRSDVATAIDEALSALAANDLPPELQRHVYEVVTHVRRCLEEYALFGDFELAAAIQRLMAVVQAATAYTEQNPETSPSASTWSKVQTRLYDPFVVSVVGGLSGSILPLMIAGGAA